MNEPLHDLRGLTVLLTRTPADSEAWAGPLREAGASVKMLPCIRTEPATGSDIASALRAALADADWLVLTSRRGVDALTDLVDPGDVPDRTLVAVVGAATAASAGEKLGRVDLVAPQGTARALARAIVEDARFAAGQRCVAALAANARSTFTDALQAAGATCTRIDVYRTIPHPPIARKQLLSALGISDLVFSSPTTVMGFVNQVEIDCDYRAWSIGPSTSDALRDAGLSLAGEAPVPGIAGIVEIIAQTRHPTDRRDGGRER